jgi:transposase
LEALKGVKTVQQIAAENEIHPVQVADWKKVLLEGAGGVFSGPRDRAEAATSEEDKDRLHAKIGELTLHVDFLKKKCKQLGIAID